MEFVIISGMSGAGKSVAMKAFEDMAFYCVDNIPPVLIPTFVELCSASTNEIDTVALVVDIRGRQFFDELEASLQSLKARGIKYKILFLECGEETLVKRYKEARRTHPLLPEGRISDGIAIEREKLKFIRESADYILDTSSISIWELRNEIKDIFIEGKTGSPLTLSFTSFGYKKGIPMDADLVFDVRFLPNPFYIEEIRHLTGNDPVIQDYVMHFQEAQIFIEKIKDLLDFLLPYYIKEGKSQLVVAIGCTGGKHRSVTLANKLHDHFKKGDMLCTCTHRDVENGYSV